MYNKKVVGNRFINVFLVYDRVDNLNKIIDSIKVSWDVENLQITKETEICSTLTMAEQVLFNKGNTTTGPWFGKILTIKINQNDVKSDTNGSVKLKFGTKDITIESQKVYETGKKENWRPHLEFHSSKHAVEFIALKAKIEDAIRIYKNLKKDKSKKQQAAIIFRNMIQTYYPTKSLEHIMQELKFLLKEPSSTHRKSLALYIALKDLKEKDYTLRGDVRSDLKKDFDEQRMETTECKDFTGNSKDAKDYNQASDFQSAQMEEAIKERRIEELAAKKDYHTLDNLSGTSQRSQPSPSVSANLPYAPMPTPTMSQNARNQNTYTQVSRQFATTANTTTSTNTNDYGTPIYVDPPNLGNTRVSKAKTSNETDYGTMPTNETNDNNYDDDQTSDTHQVISDFAKLKI